MTEALEVAVFALAGLLVLLQIAIVVERIRSNRVRKRIAELRPGIETALALYVADPEADPPDPPSSPLGRMQLREVAIEAIVELRGRERERLAHLLEELGTVDELCDDLLSKDPVTRRDAAEGLGELRSQRSARELSFCVRDPDPDSRLACARALAELGDEAFVGAVIDAADGTAEQRPGAAAAVLLSVGLRTPEGLAYALDKRRSPALRRLAAGVVTELRLAEHAPLLRDALDDEDDELVSRAARGLGEIGDADAVEDLLAVLESEDRPWFCRVVVVTALGAIGDPEVVPALERQLDSDRWLLRDRVATALRRLGQPGREALVRALDSSVPEIRDQAAVALEQ